MNDESDTILKEALILIDVLAWLLTEGKPRKISGKTDGVPAEIRTEHFLSTK
jgi:hypothetical protein